MKARWARPVAALTFGALVALGGCGDDDDAGTTTTSTETTERPGARPRGPPSWVRTDPVNTLRPAG